MITIEDVEPILYDAQKIHGLADCLMDSGKEHFNAKWLLSSLLEEHTERLQELLRKAAKRN